MNIKYLKLFNIENQNLIAVSPIKYEGEKNEILYSFRKA